MRTPHGLEASFHHLEQHMAYRCSVKKYGTVLYRFGGDLVHALNLSLGQARYQAANIPVMEKKTQVVTFRQPCQRHALLSMLNVMLALKG